MVDICKDILWVTGTGIVVTIFLSFIYEFVHLLVTGENTEVVLKV